MSEPLGCSDHYCQESAIPCLETVSEEARRHTGMPIEVCNHSLNDVSEIFTLPQPLWMATIYPTIISAIHLSIHRRRVGSQITIEALDQSAYITTI